MSEIADISARISKKTFLSAAVILLCLLVLSGILTRVVPTGSYLRSTVDGKVVIDVNSFEYTHIPPPAPWRWFTAPFEVMWGDEGAVVVAIVAFFLLSAGAINIMNKCGIFNYTIARIVHKYEAQKYRLLAVVIFVLMLIAATTGIADQSIFLVPVMLPLAYSLGWDALTALGMSVLAMGFGFAAGLTNPFTIGVAQRIADVPLFSGLWFRVLIFIVVYVVYCTFMVNHAKRIERDPKLSPVFSEDVQTRKGYGDISYEILDKDDGSLAKASRFLVGSLALMLVVSIVCSLIPNMSTYAFPIITVVFVVGGIGSGIASGTSRAELVGHFLRGLIGISPGALLTLMAAGVKHLISTSGILDTIIFAAANRIQGMPPFFASMMVYMLALFMNFFITSASAKSLIMMPILAPLSDIVGLTRQVTCLAFQFGDGFSNEIYPTNPITLISIGLAGVSYPKWFKWTVWLQLAVLAITVGFLFIAVAINLGPV
jgi:uncharacterized ion transporter superfamily protein YfcC